MAEQAYLRKTRPRLTGKNLVRPREPVNPERIRLSREAELRDTIAKNSELQSWLAEFGDQIRERQASQRRQHLASSVRVTPRISPKLSRRFECVREILGAKFDAELYIENSAEVGAACMAVPDGPMVVTITSTTVEKFTPCEQLFIMGHEVGHYILGHHEWPVGAIVTPRADGEPAVPPLLALQLLSWSRCCELSADRYGLLCAQSEESMAQAFLKIASGLPAELIGSGDDYLGQLDEWKATRSEQDGWAATHPLHAIRIHAGRSFWHSAYIDEIFGPLGDEMPALSAESADEAAALQLAAMDPDPGTLSAPDTSSRARGFLSFAGVVLVASDGEVDPREIPALVSIGDSSHVSQAIAMMRSGDLDELWRIVRVTANDFMQSASEDLRYRVLMQLVVLAFVDGHIAENEVKVMRGLALLLEIPGVTVDLLIAQLENGCWEE